MPSHEQAILAEPLPVFVKILHWEEKKKFLLNLLHFILWLHEKKTFFKVDYTSTEKKFFHT